MPANDMVITPRGGHIDTPGDVILAEVGLSVEERIGPNGERVTLLHLDVATGAEVETPFSVGIPLRAEDIPTVVSSLMGMQTPPPYMAQPPRGERLN